LIADGQLFTSYPAKAYLLIVFLFLRDQIEAGNLDDRQQELNDGPFYLKHTDDKGDHILVGDFNVIINWTFARVVPKYEAFGCSEW
jgi:hypothetical protein